VDRRYAGTTPASTEAFRVVALGPTGPGAHRLIMV
jgi:hypothetical protein